MNKNIDYNELVRQARIGKKESINALAELARERLSVYVYRLTMEKDLTDEIVQETLFEMVRILGKLKQADRFWPWLYGIATHKLHHHYRAESTRKKAVGKQQATMKERQDGFQKLVGEELRDIIASAMKKLKTRHRAVLVMRCYDGMSYAEIAESMGCSEFSTRMLFMRAKRSLQKQLSRNGLGKGALLTALVVFGKMTAPSEAAAANISVTAATIKVGGAAALVGYTTGKTAVVSLATAGVITVGSIAIHSGSDRSVSSPESSTVKVGALSGLLAGQNNNEEQYWYYYPGGSAGPLMMRIHSAGAGQSSSSQYLQNEQASYFYQGNTVYMKNHRLYADDLSVMRLPTDDPATTDFIDRMEGGRGNRKMQHVSRAGPGLLVIATPTSENGVETGRSWTTRHYNVLDESYFRGDWPGDVRIVDNRDAMHKRGWTWFRVSGSVNGRQVRGRGRIPFVFSANRTHGAWLSLQIGSAFRIVDVGSEACLWHEDGTRSKYPRGSFFEGLARPWMGMHAIDTVRRDAAEQRIPFAIESTGDGLAEVTLRYESVKIVYTIDLDNDLINRVEFFKGDNPAGQLVFTYIEDIENAGSEFVEPRSNSLQASRRNRPGPLWLVRLIEGMPGS